RSLEFRQQLLVGATESAGYQNIQLRQRREWPKRQRGKDDEHLSLLCQGRRQYIAGRPWCAAAAMSDFRCEVPGTRVLRALTGGRGGIVRVSALAHFPDSSRTFPGVREVPLWPRRTNNLTMAEPSLAFGAKKL